MRTMSDEVLFAESLWSV